MLNKRIPLALVCALFCGFAAHPVTAFDKWDVEITPVLHRMIIDELVIADEDAREQADAVFRAYTDEAIALDKTFNDLLQWNGGLMPNDHGAIDDDLERHVRRNIFRFEKQNRAARWNAVDAYFDHLCALRGINENLVRRIQKRYFVLLVLSDPEAASVLGVPIQLDELILSELPSFDDEAKRILRGAIDAYTVEIEPLVRTYRKASDAAYGKTGLLNAAAQLAIQGDLDAAKERGRQYIELGDRVVDAALPIRAAHDRFVATVASQLKPEQSQEFRRATSLLWSPHIRYQALLLLRIERGLHRDDPPAARRKALEENHAALEKIINEELRAINAVRPRFRDATWQHTVFQLTVDSIIAGATGAEPPDPFESLPDYSTIRYRHFDDLNKIEAAVDRYLPKSDEERQP